MQNNRENTLLNPYDLLTDKFPNAVYENDRFITFSDEQKEYDLIKHSTAIKLNFYITIYRMIMIFKKKNKRKKIG